jgi:hypothetical protein
VAIFLTAQLLTRFLKSTPAGRVKCVVTESQRMSFSRSETKLIRGASSLFHSWTLIGILSLTRTPQWFTNFFALFFGWSSSTVLGSSFVGPRTLFVDVVDPEGYVRRNTKIQQYIYIQINGIMLNFIYIRDVTLLTNIPRPHFLAQEVLAHLQNSVSIKSHHRTPGRPCSGCWGHIECHH